MFSENFSLKSYVSLCVPVSFRCLWHRVAQPGFVYTGWLCLPEQSLEVATRVSVYVGRHVFRASQPSVSICMFVIM